MISEKRLVEIGGAMGLAAVLAFAVISTQNIYLVSGDNPRCGPPTLSGDDTSETITGTTDPDTIQGKGGNDRIFGRNGSDHLCGQDGDDQIFGENQDDFLKGGDGNDNLFGQEGSDYADGGPGVDRCQAEVEVDCESD